MRKLSNTSGVAFIYQTSDSLRCARFPGCLLGSRAGWSFLQGWGPLSYCSTPPAFRPCAEPGLPQQVGQGARPASGPRKGGHWENTTILHLNECVGILLGALCWPSFLSLSLTIRSVTLAPGCRGLNLGSTTYWLSTLDKPLNFPRPQCPRICIKRIITVPTL